MFSHFFSNNIMKTIKFFLRSGSKDSRLNFLAIPRIRDFWRETQKFLSENIKSWGLLPKCLNEGQPWRLEQKKLAGAATFPKRIGISFRPPDSILFSRVAERPKNAFFPKKKLSVSLLFSMWRQPRCQSGHSVREIWRFFPTIWHFFWSINIGLTLSLSCWREEYLSKVFATDFQIPDRGCCSSSVLSFFFRRLPTTQQLLEILD